MPKNPPKPEPQPMARLFDHIYLTAEPGFWRLSDLARSKETMLRAFDRARSFRAPSPLTVASFFELPPACATDYIRIARMATATAAEVEMAIDYLHTQNPGHCYPAALIDPMHRTGRWP
jgi:hypothetical protein